MGERIQVRAEVRPIAIPNFLLMVGRDGELTGQSLPLSGASADGLSALCDDFRRRVFEKAGKTDPAARVRDGA